MKITKKNIENVAHLARLNLKEDELELMTGQLDNILSYANKLKKIDTAGIKPTFHVFSISNAFREDKVKTSLTQIEAVANGPQQNGESFQVPRVI